MARFGKRAAHALFAIILSASIGTALAQESPERLDSVVALLDPAVRDTNQLDLLIMAAESWYTSDNAYPYLARMDSLSLELLESPNADVRRRARHARGAFHYFTGYHAKFARNIPLALRSLRAALADFQVHDERHAMAETYDALGVLHRAVGRPDRSIGFFQEELRLGRALKHAHVIDQALVHLASAHIEQHQLRVAEVYLDSCVASSPADSSAVLLTRAMVRTSEGRHAEAMQLLQAGLSLARHSDNPWDQLPVLAPMARSYYAVGDHINGLAAARDCAVIAAEMEDQTARCGCIVLMGIGELALGDLAAAERDLLEGLRLAEVNHDVGVARELGDEGSMVRASELLKDLYRKQGRTAEALAMTTRWAALKDSVSQMGGQDEILLFQFQREQLVDSLANAERTRLQQVQHDQQIGAEKARRNMFALLGLLLLVVVVAIGGRVRLLRRTNAAILETQDQLLQSEKALEAEAVRTRIARDVHDQLGSDLTKLSMLGGEVRASLEDDPASIPTLAADIDRIAAEATRSLSDIVWAVDPTHDTLIGLMDRARHFCEHMFHGSGIAHQVECAVEGPDRHIDPATKRDLYLILRESVNNAVKYARATHVHVSFIARGNNVVLHVQDDGMGFNLSEGMLLGHGLRNLDERATRLGGHIAITSKPGSGTSVRLEVSLS